MPGLFVTVFFKLWLLRFKWQTSRECCFRGPMSEISFPFCNWWSWERTHENPEKASPWYPNPGAWRRTWLCHREGALTGKIMAVGQTQGNYLFRDETNHPIQTFHAGSWVNHNRISPSFPSEDARENLFRVLPPLRTPRARNEIQNSPAVFDARKGSELFWIVLNANCFGSVLKVVFNYEDVESIT